MLRRRWRCRCRLWCRCRSIFLPCYPLIVTSVLSQIITPRYPGIMPKFPPLPSQRWLRRIHTVGAVLPHLAISDSHNFHIARKSYKTGLKKKGGKKGFESRILTSSSQRDGYNFQFLENLIKRDLNPPVLPHFILIGLKCLDINRVEMPGYRVIVLVSETTRTFGFSSIVFAVAPSSV